MPVRHDSEEWQKMITDVATLKSDVKSIDGRMTAMEKIQDERHEENQDRMVAIEAQVDKMFAVMNRVEGAFEGAKSIGKLIAWLLGIAIAMQTLIAFYGPLLRAHLGLPNSSSAPATISQRTNQQFNATIPTL